MTLLWNNLSEMKQSVIYTLDYLTVTASPSQPLNAQQNRIYEMQCSLV